MEMEDFGDFGDFGGLFFSFCMGGKKGTPWLFYAVDLVR
jgi:hypothetical protein